MPQRLVLKQQTSLRTRIHFAIAGVTTCVVVASGMFLANHFGNTSDSLAGTSSTASTYVLPLLPTDAVEDITVNSNLPQLAVSAGLDSVSFNIIATNTTVIDGAEIKIFNENQLQAKPIVINVPQRLNRKSYKVAVAKQTLADKVRVETKANIVSAKKLEQSNGDEFKWYNLFSFNKETNAALAIPINVRAENVQDKSATISWASVNNAIKYIVRCRPVGTTEWKKGLVTAPGNKRFLVNLSPKTEYEVEVQSIVYMGRVDTSGFSFPIRFKTAEEMVHQKPIELSEELPTTKKKK